MKIEVGTKLHAMWGAMYPIEDLVVVKFEDGRAVCMNDDGEKHYIEPHTIRMPGETTVSGSPIGVYYGEY